MSQQIKIDNPEGAVINGVRGNVVFRLVGTMAKNIEPPSTQENECTLVEMAIAQKLYRHLQKLYTKGYQKEFAHKAIRNKFANEAMAVKG